MSPRGLPARGGSAWGRCRVPAPLLLLLLALPGLAQAQEAPGLVFVVRHAERLDDSPDSPLSPDGWARARTLARTLGEARVTHLVATDRRRTRQTLEPLRYRLDAEVAVVPLGDGVAAHVDRTVDLIRALPASSVVVVAGHSNTVPRIAGALVGEELDDLPAWDYDGLYVVVSDGEAGTVHRLRFGAASRRP